MWLSVSRASRSAGAGPSRVIRDQILLCAAVDASVNLASLDVVVRTVTALCNWYSPLYITFAPELYEMAQCKCRGITFL